MTEAVSADTGTSEEMPQPLLSFTQDFLCSFSDSDDSGPFGPRYHGVRGWRLRGELDVAALEQALADVVARHESLRTVLVRGEAGWHQRILPSSKPDLTVHDLIGTAPADRDRRAEELLNEVESSELSYQTVPHVEAVFGRFDNEDGVLVLAAHHAAIDAWSMQLLMRELIDSYAARVAGHALGGEVRQYREFAAWQRQVMTAEKVAGAAGYWRETLDGARFLGLGVDRRRPPGVDRSTAVHRFVVDAALTGRVVALAKTMRSSPFMVLLAAFNVFLRRRLGTDDISVPTISFGRNNPEFEQTVGPFFNFIPLRTRLSDCRSFRDVVAATRRTCLGAQENEIPFAYVLPEASELMSTFGDEDQAVFAFQAFQYSDQNELDSGTVTCTEIRHRTLHQERGSDIPDGGLWTVEIDPHSEMYGSVRYDSHQFDEATVRAMVDGYRAALCELVDAPDAPAVPASEQGSCGCQAG